MLLLQDRSYLSWYLFWIVTVLIFSSCLNVQNSPTVYEEYMANFKDLTQKMDHCEANAQKKYSCWIGSELLSRNGTFYKILESQSNANGTIILAFADFSFVDMAINLHETFRTSAITNFLFVCTDKNACHALSRRGIQPFFYSDQILSKQASNFGSDQFAKKTGIKMKILSAAIMLGFKTLLTDVDVVFLRDPIPYLPKDIDVAMQDDGVSGLNSGFMLVNPTYASVRMMQNTLDIVMTKIIIDQQALNFVINQMVTSKSLNVIKLNKYMFPNGEVYFEYGKHMFVGDQNWDQKPLIIHNNWIFTKVSVYYVTFMALYLNLIISCEVFCKIFNLKRLSHTM